MELAIGRIAEGVTLKHLGAVLEGDQFIINGQKIWTSGAQHANWMFALVRTDPDAPKHDGISFVLLEMDQPGVTVKPIRLLSGESPFNETFFDNAIARKDDLIGEIVAGLKPGRESESERNLFWHKGFAISDIMLGSQILAMIRAARLIWRSSTR